MTIYFVTFTTEKIKDGSAFIKINSDQFEYIDSKPINTNREVAKLFKDAIIDFINDIYDEWIQYGSPINITSVNLVHTIHHLDKPCC